MSKKLGERLTEAGLVTAEAVQQALAHQKITGHRLGDCLVELGLVAEATMLRFLASELNTRFVTAEKLAKAKIPPEVLDRVPVRMAEAQGFMPLAIDLERKILSVVSAEPQNTHLLKEIALVTEMEEVYAYVGLRGAIAAAIKKHYYGDTTAFSTAGAASPSPAETPLGPAFDPTSPGARVPPGLAFETDPRSRVSRPGGSSARFSSSQLRDSFGLTRAAVGDHDYVETLNILVGLLEATRKDLRGHSAQLARKASTLARRMGLTPREVSQIAIAAYLHDVAKRPDRHFSLASNAQDSEWKADAKRHLRAPIKLFETVHLPVAVNTILAQLYEAYDGSGTPQGAKGEDIVVGARIIAAVDSYLDLTKNSANAYGRCFGKEEAIGHLQAESGRLYDPAVVETLGRLLSGELLRQRVACDGRQLLVADPNGALRRSLFEALSREGLVVHTAAKLDGVIDAVLAGEAEVLVVGLGFGLNEVVGLVQFVRAQPECAATPVVVLGEPPDAATRERLSQAGASAILSPDADPTEAAKTIVMLYRDRVEHGAPGRVVRGSFDELAPVELLRLLGQGRKSGRVSLRNGSQQGQLHLERGRAVYASFGGKTGEEALDAIVKVSQAEFSYDPEALLLELPDLDRDLEQVARPLEE